MKEHEISTPNDLDAALSGNALRRRSNLWKAAEGRSFLWRDAFSGVVAALLLVVGITRFLEDPASGTIQIAIALVMVSVIIWGHLQRQVNALVELVKGLAQERS